MVKYSHSFLIHDSSRFQEIPSDSDFMICLLQVHLHGLSLAYSTHISISEKCQYFTIVPLFAPLFCPLSISSLEDLSRIFQVISGEFPCPL